MAAPDSPGDEDETLYERILDVLMTGVAIIIPFVVTLYLIRAGVDFVYSGLQPFIEVLQWMGIIDEFRQYELVVLLLELGVLEFFTEIIALLILFAGIILVGFVGRNRYGEAFIGYLDLAIASIPGIGTVYKSFRRMGDVMLHEGAENFQDIKLVQAMDEDMYLLGFETSSAPEPIEEATGHDEMVTMFIPLAPNPVTGGFLTHVPEAKVYDVDMTIEEGVRSILTSGIASGKRPGNANEITMGDLDQLTDMDLQNALAVERPEWAEGEDDEKRE